MTFFITILYVIVNLINFLCVQKVCIKGMANIKTLIGLVNVFGSNIGPNHDTVQIFSPSTSSLLTISECSEANPAKRTDIKRLLKEALQSKPPELFKKVMLRAKKAASILLMRSLETIETTFVCGFQCFEQIFSLDLGKVFVLTLFILLLCFNHILILKYFFDKNENVHYLKSMEQRKNLQESHACDIMNILSLSFVTKLKICLLYYLIYYMLDAFDIADPSSMQDACPMSTSVNGPAHHVSLVSHWLERPTGRPWVQFPLGTQIFSLSHARDKMNISSLSLITKHNKFTTIFNFLFILFQDTPLDSTELSLKKKTAALGFILVRKL